jgi:hypothetical protein
MISPNGRYLAYSDAKGLHLKAIAGGETRTISLPDNRSAQGVEWRCAAWWPDSSGFLANLIPVARDASDMTDEDVSIWSVAVDKGIPRKLRSNAFAWSISPHGSTIAFGTNKGPHGPREIWLMRTENMPPSCTKVATIARSGQPHGRQMASESFTRRIKAAK